MTGCVPTQAKRQLRFNASTGSLVPINSPSGPFSPSKEISVFTPIFFGPGETNGGRNLARKSAACNDVMVEIADLPANGGASDNSNVSAGFQDRVENGPPLPPRIRHTSKPITLFHDVSESELNSKGVRTDYTC